MLLRGSLCNCPLYMSTVHCICCHNGLSLSLLYVHTETRTVGYHQPSEDSTKGNGKKKILYAISIVSVMDEVRITLC